MRYVLRYRTAKPDDGHFSMQLHEGGTILFFNEHWDSAKGWEVILDVMEDTRRPRERRNFFICNAGDPLDFLGDHGDLYYVATHESKAYASYLFETTHLSETEREKGKIDPKRYRRRKPTRDELSTTERRYVDRPPLRTRAQAVAEPATNGHTEVDEVPLVET